MPPTITHPCAVCGTPFEVHRKDHRFCSAKCRLVWFQQKPEKERQARDAKVRLLLKTELDSNRMRTKEDKDHVRRRLGEALKLLRDPPPTPPHEEDADARP